MAETADSSQKSKTENTKDEGLVLYHFPSSYYSQKVVFALHEKKLKFRSHNVNLLGGEQFEPWFLKLNPKGEVPVLKDGVKIIPDSGRIIDYLEDNFTNDATPKLKLEKGNSQYQTMERFQGMLDKVPMELLTFGSILHPELTKNMKMSEKEKTFRKGRYSTHIAMLEELAEKNRDLKDFYKGKIDNLREREATVKNIDGVQRAISELGSLLTDIEKELATHEEDKKNWWLCGENFTTADITLALILNRLKSIGLWDHFFSDSKRPKLNDYFKRIQMRSAFRKTVNQGCGILGHICCMGTTEKLAVSVSGAVIVLGVAGLAFFLTRRNR